MGAQRLTASKVSAPEPRLRYEYFGKVLNALRHQRFRHRPLWGRPLFLVGAQRLTASKVSARRPPEAFLHQRPETTLQASSIPKNTKPTNPLKTHTTNLPENPQSLATTSSYQTCNHKTQQPTSPKPSLHGRSNPLAILKNTTQTPIAAKPPPKSLEN